MTRAEQQASNPAYRDWRAAYTEDVRERVKHWGDKRKRASQATRAYAGDLEGALFAPGGQND